MIHESKDGLAGNGCADSGTQAAQHMGLHQTALAALPVVPAACRGADAGVEKAYKIGYSEGFAAGEEAMKNLIDKLTSPTISN